MAHWEEVVKDVYQFQDSCLVYAVKGPNGLVLINAGTVSQSTALVNSGQRVRSLYCSLTTSGITLTERSVLQRQGPKFWDRIGTKNISSILTSTFASGRSGTHTITGGIASLQ